MTPTHPQEQRQALAAHREQVARSMLAVEEVRRDHFARRAAEDAAGDRMADNDHDGHG